MTTNKKSYFTQVTGWDSKPTSFQFHTVPRDFFFSPAAGFHGNASVTNLNKCGWRTPENLEQLRMPLEEKNMIHPSYQKCGTAITSIHCCSILKTRLLCFFKPTLLLPCKRGKKRKSIKNTSHVTSTQWSQTYQLQNTNVVNNTHLFCHENPLYMRTGLSITSQRYFTLVISMSNRKVHTLSCIKELLSPKKFDLNTMSD